MDAAAYANHIAILNEELVCALGCTEPIAVAYAASLARAALGTMPEHMSVACSGNIIKNVKSVTVPNSGGMRGIEAAALLGALGGDETRALEVLEAVTEDDRKKAAELIAAKACSVELVEGVPNLYVRVTATAGGHTAIAQLEERHTNVTKLELDGAPVSVAGVTAVAKGEAEAKEDPRGTLSLSSIWEFARTVKLEDIDELISRQITTNKAISDEGLRGDWGANIGRTLLRSRSNDITCKARASAAAGSDARMSGCAMPVTICCGSGNQGITCSMPVLEYAHELWASHEALVRAVALSDLTARQPSLTRWSTWVASCAMAPSPAVRQKSAPPWTPPSSAATRRFRATTSCPATAWWATRPRSPSAPWGMWDASACSPPTWRSSTS